jgi:hypothetical protein
MRGGDVIGAWLRTIGETAGLLDRVVVELGESERDEESPAPLSGVLRVEEGLLVGPGVKQDISKKWSRSRRLETMGPDMVVTHATATRWGTRDALLAAIRPATGREASWHVLIDELGGIVQSIPFSRAAWHAGSSSAAKVDIGGRLYLPNQVSVGIEMVNAGEVRWVVRGWRPGRTLPVPRKGDWVQLEPAWRAWPFAGGVYLDPITGKQAERGPGPVIPEAQTVAIRDRRYHGYTRGQRYAHRDVMEALRRAYPRIEDQVALVRGKLRTVIAGHLVGHRDIDPERKPDPHPSWYLTIAGTIR